jgi:hypothetical protein
MRHGRKKYPKFTIRKKYRFSPIAPRRTSARLQITQNRVDDLFLCILFNFEVKRTLFGKTRKKIQDDDFFDYTGDTG